MKYKTRQDLKNPFGISIVVLINCHPINWDFMNPKYIFLKKVPFATLRIKNNTITSNCIVR